MENITRKSQDESSEQLKLTLPFSYDKKLQN